MEKIKNLGAQGFLNQLGAAKTAIENFANGVGAWKFPVEFGPKRVEFLARCTQVAEAVAELQKHTKALANTVAGCKGTQHLNQRTWRAQRDNLRDWLVKRGVPACVAKVYADLVYGKYHPPADVGIKIAYSCPELDVTKELEEAPWSSTFICRYNSDKGNEARSHVEATFAKLY